MSSSYLISVVICTFNRSSLLKTCLESLVTQTEDMALFEIIVVNNNSSDDTQEMASTFVSKFTNVRVVLEQKQGLSRARNRGWQEAQAKWVAYIDDDARASTNWIHRALYIMSNSNFDAFGGIYLPWYRDGKTVWYLDEYGSNQQYLPGVISVLPKGIYFSGGNCFFKKDLLVKNGGFNPLLGMSRKKIQYGEETRVQANLLEKGYILGCDQELVVFHYVPLRKQKFYWFFKSNYAMGRDYWFSVKQAPTLYAIVDLLALSVIRPLKLAPEAIRKLIKGEYRVQNVLIELLKPSIRCVGSIISGIVLLFVQK